MLFGKLCSTSLHSIATIGGQITVAKILLTHFIVAYVAWECTSEVPIVILFMTCCCLMLDKCIVAVRKASFTLYLHYMRDFCRFLDELLLKKQ